MHPGEIVIPLAVFFTIGYIVKTTTDNRLRKKVVEKGIVDDKIKYLFRNYEEHGSLSSLKWGMISTAVGLGLLVGYLMPNYQYNQEIIFAFMFIFAGVALLLYYVLAERILKRRRSED